MNTKEIAYFNIKIPSIKGKNQFHSRFHDEYAIYF